MPTYARREMHAVAMLAILSVVPFRLAVGFRHQLAGPQSLGRCALAQSCPRRTRLPSDRETPGVSHRIITVLEGEGLFNDATSLCCFLCCDE